LYLLENDFFDGFSRKNKKPVMENASSSGGNHHSKAKSQWRKPSLLSQ
jgi:hypothetical protein